VDAELARAAVVEPVDEGRLRRAVVWSGRWIGEVDLEDGDVVGGEETDDLRPHAERNRLALVCGPCIDVDPAAVAVADNNRRDEQRSPRSSRTL
jgi:hypothetical protein